MLNSIPFLGYKTVTTRPQSSMHIVMKEDNAQLGRSSRRGLWFTEESEPHRCRFYCRPGQDTYITAGAGCDKSFAGAVPGLTVINSSGDINSEPTLRIRGLGTLSNSQTSSPYIVVDGVPVDDLDDQQQRYRINQRAEGCCRLFHLWHPRSIRRDSDYHERWKERRPHQDRL